MGIVNEQHVPYREFRAAWASGPDVFKLKERTEGQSISDPSAPELIFVGIGLGDAENVYPEVLAGCPGDVERFAGILEHKMAEEGRINNFKKTVITGRVSRKDALLYLEAFSAARKQDTCILYYAGIGLANPRMDKGFLDFIFSDDSPEDIINHSKRESTINNTLERILSGRRSNLVIIADFVRIYMDNENQLMESPVNFPEGNFICLQNCSPHKVTEAFVAGPQSSDNHNFSSSLLYLLENEGLLLSYHDFFNRLVIRMAQSEDKRRPKLLAIPAIAAEMTLFTPEKKPLQGYRLQFDTERSMWRINAGRLQGIRPSVYLMPTLFKLEEGITIAVREVEEQYSYTEGSDELDRSMEYSAALVQNAISKISIAFHEHLDPGMKEQFSGAVERKGLELIELLPDAAGAQYIIHQREREYFLVSNTRMQDQSLQRPLCGYHFDVYAFITQIEQIARWQGVLELDNGAIGLSKDLVELNCEVIEGQSLQIETIESLNGTHFTQPDRLILHYRDLNGRMVQPAFRCSIMLKPEESVTKNSLPDYYVTILHLNGDYGINSKGVIPEEVILQQGKPDHLLYVDQHSERRFRTIPVILQKHFIDRGIFEVYEYIKIFISKSPLDLSGFLQEKMPDGNNTFVQTEDFRFDERKVIVFPSPEWTVITLPLKIVFDQQEMSKTPA